MKHNARGRPAATDSVMKEFDPTRHLKTESTEQDGVTVFTLRGECDMHTAPYCRLDVTPALLNGGRVVLDLRPTTFMDSAGYGMLVGLARAAQDNGGRLAIVAPPSGIVLTGLRVLQVDRALAIAPTLEEAIALAREDGPSIVSPTE